MQNVLAYEKILMLPRALSKVVGNCICNSAILSSGTLDFNLISKEVKTTKLSRLHTSQPYPDLPSSRHYFCRKAKLNIPAKSNCSIPQT